MSLGCRKPAAHLYLCALILPCRHDSGLFGVAVILHTDAVKGFIDSRMVELNGVPDALDNVCNTLHSVADVTASLPGRAIK